METVISRAVKDISREELENLKREALKKAVFRRRVGRLALTGVNLLMALFLLLPLLYAVSIALMPSGELFTTSMNLIPATPTDRKSVV